MSSRPTAIKTWRESEVLMTLAAMKEKALQYRKGITVLREAELPRAARAMTELLESAERHIARLNKELDRRGRPATIEPGPSNLVQAFRL